MSFGTIRGKKNTVEHSGANVVNIALMYSAARFPLTGGDRKTWGDGVCDCDRKRRKTEKNKVWMYMEKRGHFQVKQDVSEAVSCLPHILVWAARTELWENYEVKKWENIYICQSQT